jgi:hypothetical protein
MISFLIAVMLVGGKDGEMIRRDYILRMIERFAQMLARIQGELGDKRFADASKLLDDAFVQLLGTGPEAVSRLSETELLAQLAKDEPTQVLREKTLLLVAFLNEAGRLHAIADPPRELEANACWTKALDLLLMMHLQDTELEFPDFVPKIELIRQHLGEAVLPLRTVAALWRYYERIGAYAKAEDALYVLREADFGNPDLRAEARAFYERLLRESDASLDAGNLPRDEVESALADLGKG